MIEMPATQASLLIRIRDPGNQEAWRQFTEIYAPLIYGFARRRGLQDADAADLTQDVMRAVANAAKALDYDPRRGLFRSWLYTLCRHELHDFLVRRKRHCQGSGDTGVHELINELAAPEEEAERDREYERRVFIYAAERVRRDFEETTWRAFWNIAVEGKSGDETAKALGMSVGAVYVAKSRVLARIKERIRELQAE